MATAALPRRLALSLPRPQAAGARTFLSTPAKPSRALSSISKLLPQFSGSSAACSSVSKNSARWSSIQQARTFTSSRKLFNANEAPNAKAYMASGVISGGRDLVDVNKVLVIGSGGLSIGQAGEFDYSGMISHSLERSGDTQGQFLTVSHNRFSGYQGSQGGGNDVDSHQSQHCYDSDLSLPGR